MKIAKPVILLFVVIGNVIVFLLAVAGVAVGQTNAPRSTPNATAHIPYDFWIAGTRLPAGDSDLLISVPRKCVRHHHLFLH